MPASTGLVDRHVVRTRDPEVASRTIAAIYGDNDINIGRPAPDFEMSISACQAGELASSVYKLGFDGRPTATVEAAFTAITLQAGQTTYVPDGGQSYPLRAGDVWLTDPGRPTMGITTAGCVIGSLQLSTSAMADAASDTADQDAEPVAFLAPEPVDDAAGSYWHHLMVWAHRVLADPAAGLDAPLLRQHFEQTLARGALVTFPNTTMTGPDLPHPGFTGPATLRRAVTYIHAHADAPLTVADLARAAGIGVRALQDTFRQHLDRTPQQYLQQVRLHRAHRELQAADPTTGDTVTTIARRWGFTNAGRFAAQHHAAYGETPAQTLRT